MPSVIISVILQHAEMILMLGWSTTNTFHSGDFTDRITSFRIPATSQQHNSDENHNKTKSTDNICKQ